MAPAAHLAPRKRRTFSHLERSPARAVLDVPNLIDIQRRSFEGFMDRASARPSRTSRRSRTTPAPSPWSSATTRSTRRRSTSPSAARPTSTFSAPLSMTVRFVNRDTGEIREQRVFMGDFPLMTPAGTFIINGTERVIVTQLVRSPGAYIMEPRTRPSRSSRPTSCRRAARGSSSRSTRRAWSTPASTASASCRSRRCCARCRRTTRDRRAAGDRHVRRGRSSRSSAIRRRTSQPLHPRTRSRRTPARRRRRRSSSSSRSSAPASRRPSRTRSTLLRTLFFDPKRYDLTRVGRYKLNRASSSTSTRDIRVLDQRATSIELIRRLVSLPIKLGAESRRRGTTPRSAVTSRATRPSCASSTSTRTSATAACAPSAS